MTAQEGVQGILRSYNIGENDVVLLLFVLMFCVVAYVIGSSKHLLAYRVRDFFSSKRTYTDADAEVNRSEVSNTVLLSITSSLSLAIVISNHLPLGDLCMKLFGASNLYVSLGFAFACVIIYVLMKTFVYLLVNSVFFRHEENKSWMSSFYLLYSFSALLIYPVSLIDVYSKLDSSFVTFCLFAILILCKFFLFYRLCVNFRVKFEGLLLIFLYFCSVEIMPLLVIGKFCLNIM